MSRNRPIILIDDDPDDQALYISVLEKLPVHNPVKALNNGEEALAYLLETRNDPFLIVCDVKMPKMGGIELRRKIVNNPTLHEKAIPFLFMTGNADQNDVRMAYDMSVQGFFTKPDSIEQLTQIFRTATQYWSLCRHPNMIKDA